jgi:hypothetical protein
LLRNKLEAFLLERLYQTVFRPEANSEAGAVSKEGRTPSTEFLYRNKPVLFKGL